jgi:hypothetical protein
MDQSILETITQTESLVKAQSRLEVRITRDKMFY